MSYFLFCLNRSLLLPYMVIVLFICCSVCLLLTVWTWQVMLGVDRLDMIKGIPQKILAFEKFLEENPTWRDKVVLLQIAVPTRTDVPECMHFPLPPFSCF